MTQPYLYQLKGVRALCKMGGRGLLCDEMGLGKTLQSLLVAQRLAVRPIIIICPASIRWQWERECSRHIGLRADILQTTKPYRKGYLSSPRAVIINYDILRPWKRYLASLNPQMLIIDEGHMIGNRGTIRSRTTKWLAQNIPHVLVLTGTPITNRPAEMWNLLNILWPDDFPNFHAFAFRHGGPRKTPWGWSFQGASHLAELNRKLQGRMIRRRKLDVLADLPAKQRTVVPLEISSRKEYNHALDDFIGWIGEKSPEKLRTAAKAEALVKLGYLKRLAAKLKLPSVMEWVDNFLTQTEEKLVLFAVHRKIISCLHKRYAANSVVVDGTIIRKKRQLAIDKFLHSPKCRILIGNIQAAGVGWNAKGVSTICFCELPWTPGAVTQAEDRAHGIGRGIKGKHTAIYFLVARETIEAKLLKLLQKKQQILRAVVDAGNGEDLDIFDKLIEELRKENNDTKI